MTEDESAAIPESLAWHYTSSSGLRGIIETNSLRATSAAFMNDANELKTGVGALKKAYERLKSTLADDERGLVERGGLLRESAVFDSFLVSASLDGDLLTLWRYYGNDSVAYSVGFDRDVPLQAREQVGGDQHPSPPPGYHDREWEMIEGQRSFTEPDPDYVGVFGGNWRPVTYVHRDGSEAHAEYIRKYIGRRQYNDGLNRFFFDVGAFADSPINLEKDNGFSDEREIRIIVDVNPAWKFVKFRENQYGLVPYIELASGSSVEAFVPIGPQLRLPIRHIMVGPTSTPEIAKRALRLFLDNNGYGDVTIGSSEIPFR
ncbi:hypothetical protein [Glaciibacter psychrotolerans]|uniref:DUF2971 domain-containing protein n=1 Tax=Glaciibacter psychrotolerans TaxID=670054 RepID=A0A7Z0EBD7_9MICO|nr:hypothetical protein [Leifsonia psychrotolerans]NYJ18495.1 hypothetical protein [Leifsonia psychrotolerans]